MPSMVMRIAKYFPHPNGIGIVWIEPTHHRSKVVAHCLAVVVRTMVILWDRGGDHVPEYISPSLGNMATGTRHLEEEVHDASIGPIARVSTLEECV